MHARPTTRAFDFEGLVLSLEQNRARTVLATAEAGVVPFVLASIRHRLDRPLVIVTPTVDRADQLISGLSSFEGELWPGLTPVLGWEGNDVSPWQEINPMRRIAQGRIAAGYRLMNDLGVAAIVLPAAALLWRTLGGGLLEAGTSMASRGDELDRLELAEQLVDAGYERAPVVEDPGSFSMRGGVFDVWSPLYDQPLRIDLFDDEVESIRFFDPESQSSGGEVIDAILPPAYELLLGAAARAGVTERLTALANEHGLGNVALRALLEEVEAGHRVPGMEALLPAITPELRGLLELADDAGGARPIVVLEGPDACLAAIDKAWQDHQAHYAQARAEGRLACSPEALLLSPAQVRAQLEGHTELWIRPFQLAEERVLPQFQLDVTGNSEVVAALDEARRTEQGLRPLAQRIRAARRAEQLVCIACHSEGGRSRIEQILRHYGIDTVIRDTPLKPAEVETLRSDPDVGALLLLGGTGQGFVLEALHLVVLDEEEIVGHKAGRAAKRRARKQRAKKGARIISDLAELHEGDYVVHVDHGIGRYVKMVRLEAAGTEQDFLLLLYKDGQKVYVPVTQLERVQKYLSAEASPPVMDKLGSERWQKAKARTKKAIAEIAVELVRLYAEREALPGHAFSPPDEAFREWEATFPWEETPDQARAIDEVLDDLTTSRPMWRLVCGDVGYGKTEVAVRAAARVAMDGKQVAVLVPTTVLAEQHRLTFSDRLKTLPLVVESLSRFRSSAEQRDVLRGLERGDVDVVIGTHRLLSEDVRFKDLGLLIIDEEHRFGVTHKEQIARWRSTMDCLVLTATPIPRTLQMATLGLRDLSLILTPPENRKSVRTIVCRGAATVIKEAVEKELARGGQVFYLRNRVGALPEIAENIQALVPSARPVIAHGQMSEGQLEDAMLGFMRGEYNVLVATTIIESGLDIPNANTMIIERADSLGLAQLYQLRGRVGRSNVRAYCYLLVPGRDKMTSEGAKRVSVLERFSELGAGVHIATHDMEIRGAGNILGEAQSGHIAEVGYELYVRMLEEAVREVRSEELGAPIDPEIKVSVTAFLPNTYVPDANQRLMAYKRLAGVRDAEELDERVRDLVDRFGRLPPQAQALIASLELRVLAIRLGLNKVEQGPAAVAMTLHPQGLLTPDLLLGLVNRRGSMWRLTPDMVLVRSLTQADRDDPLEATRRVLEDLLRYTSAPSDVILDIAPEPPEAPEGARGSTRERTGDLDDPRASNRLRRRRIVR